MGIGYGYVWDMRAGFCFQNPSEGDYAGQTIWQSSREEEGGTPSASKRGIWHINNQWRGTIKIWTHPKQTNNQKKKTENISFGPMAVVCVQHVVP
jgi:hypothetical protein